MRVATALLAFFFATSATAQSLSANVAAPDRLIAQFRACVIGAVLDDMTPASLRTVVENTFFACSTEEQAIRAWFALSYVPPAVAQSRIVRIKLDLKKHLAPTK
jgi:hypothetical protein